MGSKLVLHSNLPDTLRTRRRTPTPDAINSPYLITYHAPSPLRAVRTAKAHQLHRKLPYSAEPETVHTHNHTLFSDS